MASAVQPPSGTVLELMEKMKADFDAELASNIAECNAKKQAADAARRGHRATISAAERKIEQLEKLLAESDGDSDIVIDSDWVVHGVGDVVPLCVVECPDCDNAVIENLEKTNLEKRVEESNHELAKAEEYLATLQAELKEKRKKAADIAIQKVPVDEALDADVKEIERLEGEIAKLDADLSAATKTRQAESADFTKSKESTEKDVEDAENEIKDKQADIDKIMTAAMEDDVCAKYVIDRQTNPRINMDDSSLPDRCKLIGVEVLGIQADIVTLEKQISAGKTKISNLVEAEMMAVKEFETQRAQTLADKEDNQKKLAEAKHSRADNLAQSDKFFKALEDLQSEIQDLQVDEGKEKTFIKEVSDLIVNLKKRISSIMSDCDECGTWRIILQGSDETSEGPDCLLGWEYSEDGDILIDEERLANNIKFITLYHKPENLLIDKRGDVWADGTKIARVALTGLVGEFFDNFDDPRLARLMIKPRFIGDNRILHVMQDGFHVICENPNSLRDELARHNLLPYHVGTYFRKRAKECDDHENHDELEELCKVECCGPPELPDCFDIGECPVTVPQWFKDWYAAHSENLYLKLPYDKRFEGDPLRYSREEQINFGNAVVDLVVRYFNSTPIQVENGFEDWFVNRGMKRILNILPLINKNNPPRGRFNLAGWTFGTNSNSPELLLPLEIDSSTGEIIECVECCDLIDSSCAPMLSFDDCCEFACGRWSQDCSYEEGDIVISKSGEACYEAMVDICAGDCNPEPGKAAETIWRKCTIDCEQDAPICDFILSDQFICADESCEAEVAVAALYALNQEQCEYLWTLTAINVYGMTPDVTVESYGHAPGESYDENNNIVVVNVPLLPVGCDDDDSSTQTYNPNTWIFRLDARATESNEVLSTCFSQEKELDLDCGFSVELWDGLDEIRSAAYNWCDEAGGDNPNGKRQGAPETEIGERVVAMESQYELLLAHIDNPDARSTQSDFYQITTAQTKVANVVSLLSTEYAVNTSALENVLENITTAVDANDFDNALKFVQDAVYMTVTTINDNQIYVGVEDCCCIIVKPDENDQAVCDLSWVWLVRSDTNSFFVPYYGGVGKQAATSVLCVERNPDQYNTTHAEVRLVSYAASCDDIVKARIEGWDGMSGWFSSSDGFEASPVCECYRTQSITCPCSPREGVANVVPVECDSYDPTKYYIHLVHNNPFNECNVDWVWQVENNDTGSVVELPAGQGLIATEKRYVELISGHNHTIKLRWISVDGMIGGVVFEQNYIAPVCPRLDLTFDFNFTESEYGDITSGIVGNTDDMLPDNYVGAATGGHGPFNISEIDAGGNPQNLYINTGDSNPYGTFKIAATHNPDLNDPHWQAVNKDAYLWKWVVRVLDGDTVVAVLESAELTSENGKAPDLISENLTADQINHTSSSYTYKVELIAIRDTVHEETNENEKLNNLHKGARTINSIAPGNSDALGYNIAIGGNSYNRTIEYRPRIDFHGMQGETYTINYSYANGETGTKASSFTINVVANPCVLNYAQVTSKEAINLPATIPAGEYELTQEFRITTEFDLHDECGELSNPDTTYNFAANVGGIINPQGEIEGGVAADFTQESVTVESGKMIVVGTLSATFDLTNITDCSSGQSYEHGGGEYLSNSLSSAANTMTVATPAEISLVITGAVTTSDHPDGGNLDPEVGASVEDRLEISYCRCWDGSLVLNVDTNGDGYPDPVCPDKPGCTNPNATNYDWQATVDDGSCIVLGCTDTNAINYNDSATQDDGSCCYEPELVSDVGGEIESQIQDDDNVTESGMVAGWRDNITSTVIGHAPSDPNIPVIKFTIPDGSFELDDAAAQSGQGTMLPGYATIQVDLEKLIANSDIQALKYSVTSGPNAKEACGYHYDYSFMGDANNVMNIRFGEQAFGRNKLNQTPSFDDTTCTFSAEASDCSAPIPPQWMDIDMGSDLVANPNSVFYLIEAHYDGAGYPCDEAVRKVVLEFTIAPQTFPAVCRKQSTDDETPCSVDQPGAVHNPDLCCYGVNVNDFGDEVIDESQAGNINTQALSYDTNGGTHNGQAYDIKVTVANGGLPLDGGGGEIRLTLDDMFTPVNQGDSLEYHWTVGPNSRTGESGGLSGDFTNDHFKLRMGGNNGTAGGRSVLGSPTTNDDAQNVYSAEYPEVLYTIKARNISCTPCDDIIESEAVTILVVVEEHIECVTPELKAGLSSAANALVATANIQSGSTFIVNDGHIDISDNGTETFVTNYGTFNNVPVIEIKIQNGYMTIGDNSVVNNIIPSGGVRWTWNPSEFFKPETIDTTGSKQTKHFRYTFYKAGAGSTWLEDEAVRRAPDGGRNLEESAFEYGTHGSTSNLFLRFNKNRTDSEFTVSTNAPDRVEHTTGGVAVQIWQVFHPDCPAEKTEVAVKFIVEDQTRSYIRGCMDTNAINTTAGAIIDDGSCCYEMPTVADDIISNLQTKVNAAFDSGSQIDTSQIAITNAGGNYRRIRFNDGAFEEHYPSGGIIAVDATDVFDFPAGKTYTDYEYTLDLLDWSGDSMNGKTSWTHVELHGDDGSVGDNQFNIRVGGSDGGGTLKSRHYLQSGVSGSGGSGDNKWVKHCIQGQNSGTGMTYKLTATDVGANDGCGDEIIVYVKVDVECQTFITGCMDNTAFNYNENAVIDDGSCVPVVEGCTDSDACNYDSNANTDDGSCIQPGCCPTGNYNNIPVPTGYAIYDVAGDQSKMFWQDGQPHRTDLVSHVFTRDSGKTPSRHGGYGVYNHQECMPTNPIRWEAVDGLFGGIFLYLTYGWGLDHAIQGPEGQMVPLSVTEIADVNLVTEIDGETVSNKYQDVPYGMDIRTAIASQLFQFISFVNIWKTEESWINKRAIPCDKVSQAVAAFAKRVFEIMNLHIRISEHSKNCLENAYEGSFSDDFDRVLKGKSTDGTNLTWIKLMNWEGDEGDLYNGMMGYFETSCEPCIPEAREGAGEIPDGTSFTVWTGGNSMTTITRTSGVFNTGINYGEYLSSGGHTYSAYTTMADTGFHDPDE